MIARQVVALSERERLHRFEIYPASAPADLKPRFHDYDRAFAAALGVALHDPAHASDDDDLIAFRLARLVVRRPGPDRAAHLNGPSTNG